MTRAFNLVGLLLVSTIIALLAAPCATAQAEGRVRVYFLAGQSNMVGQGQVSELGPPYNEPQTDVHYWNGTEWLSLAPGFGADSEKFGPEVSFGRAVKDAYPDDEIYLIKYAVGGTTLYNDWSPEGEGEGGPQYQQFMATTRAALANLEADGIDFKVCGMLWMQGETDADDRQGAAYEANLLAFIAHMREQFEVPAMPFIIARILPFYGAETGDNTLVRTAQEDVADSDKAAAWFDTDDYELLNAGHYGTEGLLRMGQDFFQSLQSLGKEDEEE